jgi:hypothetical protein
MNPEVKNQNNIKYQDRLTFVFHVLYSINLESTTYDPQYGTVLHGGRVPRTVLTVQATGILLVSY